ncbi:MAG TPA: hypothetical protein PKE29_16150 [Phycisphaerales bacterium]|nr:hypothetical protein [Phycisphaerales bacterium]
MNTTSAQLLRMLGSGVRPDSMRAAGPPATGATQAAFADLLRQARDGTLASTAPVTVAGDAEVSCTDEQLARLSLGADKLEAAGVRTAMVSIDGQRLILDVHARSIVGAASAENGVIAGIDGAMDLGDFRTGEPVGVQTAGATTARPPAGLAQNQSLVRLLADLSGA